MVLSTLKERYLKLLNMNVHVSTNLRDKNTSKYRNQLTQKEQAIRANKLTDNS